MKLNFTFLFVLAFCVLTIKASSDKPFIVSAEHEEAEPEAYQPTCLDHAFCGICEEDPRCGWCQSAGKCVEGNSTGPAFGACAYNEWFFNTCPTPPSSFYFYNHFKGFSNCNTRRDGCFYNYPSYCCTSSPCWSEAGSFNYFDMTPSGSQFGGIEITLAGHLYCPTNEPILFYVFLNSRYLGSLSSEPVVSKCVCEDACEYATFKYSVPGYEVLYPYNYGANNTVTLEAAAGSSCIGVAYGAVFYVPQVPK